MEWLTTLEAWHWLVFGIVLLIIETLGVGGFLIGIAFASLVQSAIAAFFPALSWDFQLLVFAVNAVLATVLYWKFFKKFNDKTDHADINNRAAQLIGRIVELPEAYPTGVGKVQVGDTFWLFHCESALAKGDKIIVTETKGMELIVTRHL